ncbi:MAG: helix-turn-helix transcriptional regulator [Bacteroidales bacterium]|nr:helix-turn-helix transcriptional regulator [Bacteroidales bacterium]
MKNLIKVERARKNITQAELAEIINVTRQTIHAIETGKFVPSTLLALKMAHYFGCKVEDIFQLEDEDLAQIQPRNL